MIGLSLLITVLFLVVACSSKGDDVVQSGDSWQLRGALLAWDGDVWIVDDQPVIVPPTLDVDDRRVLGATIDAAGTIDDAGRLVADDIEISEGEWPDSTLPSETVEGTVERIGVDSWVVDGHEVIVPEGVRTEGVDAVSEIAPGDAVVVDGYRLDDDRVVAVDIALMPTVSESVETQDPSADDAPTPYDPTVFHRPTDADSVSPGAGDTVTEETSSPEDTESDDLGSGDNDDDGPAKSEKPDKLDKVERDDKQKNKDNDKQEQEQNQNEKEKEKDRD